MLGRLLVTTDGSALSRSALPRPDLPLAQAAAQLGLPDVATVLLDTGHRDVARSIAEVARERGSELIGLASHGRTGQSQLLIGSVAGRMMRDSTVPVLLARGEPESQPS